MPSIIVAAISGLLLGAAVTWISKNSFSFDNGTLIVRSMPSEPRQFTGPGYGPDGKLAERPWTPHVADHLHYTIDPDTGCVYFILDSGHRDPILMPRFKANGRPMCPDAE